VKVNDIAELFDSLCPMSFPEDGVQFGDPEMQVTGVLFCWMANTRAIQRAVAEDCNVIVCHEFPYVTGRPGVPPEQYMDWLPNRRRRELLNTHALALVQSHRTMDTFCVADELQRTLGLGAPDIVEDAAGYDAVRLFHIDPASTGVLVTRWKQALGLSYVRVLAPDPDRVITRVGLAWGGIGLQSNLTIPVRLIELGAELLIGGEVEEYTLEYCADAEVDFVELGHAATEAPGMSVVPNRLAARFAGVKTVSFEEWPLYRGL